MTVVKHDKESRKIRSAEELFDRYTGFGGRVEDMRVGCETERVYYQAGDAECRPMRAQQQQDFLQKMAAVRISDAETGLKTKKIGMSEETTAQVIEEQTSAVPYAEFGKVIDQEREIAAHTTRIAAELDLKQSPFTNNPFVTHDICFNNPVAHPRHRTEELVQGFYRYLGHDPLSYTFLTSPVHCSLSYKDPDHLWGMARRMFYLTPFMYLAGDNGSNFMEKSPVPLNFHFTMMTNQRLQSRGGVPDFFYDCENGEDYIRGHINAVMNNPMLILFGDDGTEYSPRNGEFKTPQQILDERGYLTEVEFDLAESTLWPDGKICNIRDGDNNPIGKRFEIRMWDTGPHQFASMTMACVALLMDPQGGAECDALLADFGFEDTPKSSEGALRDAMQKALHHEGKFMDIPFGKPRASTGQQATMLEFAQELYPIIERTIARLDARQLPRLEPLKHICMTGETDTKVIFDHCGGLEGVRHFMHNFDPAQAYTPENGTSYYMMKQDGTLPAAQPSACGRQANDNDGSEPEPGQEAGQEAPQQQTPQPGPQ